MDEVLTNFRSKRWWAAEEESVVVAREPRKRWPCLLSEQHNGTTGPHRRFTAGVDIFESISRVGGATESTTNSIGSIPLMEFNGLSSRAQAVYGHSEIKNQLERD